MGGSLSHTQGKTMHASTAFQDCATLLDEIESTGVDILALTPRNEELLEEESITVDLSVDVPLFEEIETNGIEIIPQNTDALTEGTLTVDLAVRIPLDHEPTDQSVESQHQSETDPAQSEKEIKADGAGTLQQTVPKPYQNPDRLRDVYDEYETFEEMTDALDVDVTPETVRMNMIKQEIHEPASQSASTDDGPSDTDHDSSPSGGRESNGEADGDGEDATDEIPLPDGISLPNGITLDELKTAVETSRSFLDVQRELGGDRDLTYQLLKDLNLLDLVHGRLSKQAERNVTIEQIDKRIRQSTTHQNQTTVPSDD